MSDISNGPNVNPCGRVMSCIEMGSDSHDAYSVPHWYGAIEAFKRTPQSEVILRDKYGVHISYVLPEDLGAILAFEVEEEDLKDNFESPVKMFTVGGKK